MQNMKFIRDIGHFEGVRVLVRVDFNVPFADGIAADDLRIRAALPTIEFLRSRGAIVILISHFESLDGSNQSLEPIAKHVEKLGVPVNFVKNPRVALGQIEKSSAGDCIMLENLRMHDGEKSNDSKFAEELASLADIYVNEAFSVSHREHASIVGVPRFLPSYAGLQLEKEIMYLKRSFDPPHPSLYIVGGAKFDTKIPLLNRFLSVADNVVVAGALANDFYKVKGYEVGRSLVSKQIDAASIKLFLENPKIILPVDVINEEKAAKLATKLSPSDKIVDIGNNSLALIRERVNTAKFILWNGTLGLYEGGYTEGTEELARIIAVATKNGAETIVGGGDTLAAITRTGIAEQFSFVSTGGGAMLDFLAKGTLPGIEALVDSALVNPEQQ